MIRLTQRHYPTYNITVKSLEFRLKSQSSIIMWPILTTEA